MSTPKHATGATTNEGSTLKNIPNNQKQDDLTETSCTSTSSSPKQATEKHKRRQKHEFPLCHVVASNLKEHHQTCPFVAT
eukprot:677706-Ditylum_brightwellii.AAC.1